MKIASQVLASFNDYIQTASRTEPFSWHTCSNANEPTKQNEEEIKKNVFRKRIQGLRNEHKSFKTG